MSTTTALNLHLRMRLRLRPTLSPGYPRPFCSLSPRETALLLALQNVLPRRTQMTSFQSRRYYHDYFVTHLPSSSMHPDSNPRHKLPREASTPHSLAGSSPTPALPPHVTGRDLTVVRIPLAKARHHFGTANSRGNRPYNEDTFVLGTINMPAFAQKAPVSLRRGMTAGTMPGMGEATAAPSAYGDPQVFYFGVFDGHGGAQCSEFLRNELHSYIEEAAVTLGLRSTLQDKRQSHVKQDANMDPELEPRPADDPLPICKDLVHEYKQAIGGYFRRFVPKYFIDMFQADPPIPVTLEATLMYAFLRADLDFVRTQARLPEDKMLTKLPEAPVVDELGAPMHEPPSGHGIGADTRFKGGSTASIAMISTPNAAPFWHPGATSMLCVAHVGDTRILLCETASGIARAVTVDHHPTMPSEERRLRRYAPATSLVSGDSFGEERIAGLANSRAFGDVHSKRIGVSAEPDVSFLELGPGEFAFMVLVSDGVSGTLTDQEIVDVVKEAKTPEEASRSLVSYATEVSTNGDNATAVVVRLGGWERRQEGGMGSLGTKEMRDMRRIEAQDPRANRM